MSSSLGPKADSPPGIVAKRLRQAREAAGLSQRQLGIVSGLDISVASPRINQYEQGRHMPNLQMLARLGRILDRPLPWFYAIDDELAALILTNHRASPAKRRQLTRIDDAPVGHSRFSSLRCRLPPKAGTQ